MNGILTYILRIFWPLLVALALAACGSSSNSVEPSVRNDANNGEIILENEGQPAATVTTENFLEAAQRGLIEYRIAGNGASSGESLVINVRRTTSEPIKLYLAPGTVFTPGSSAAQSMVARRFAREIAEAAAEALLDQSGVINLIDDAWHTFVIEAYCRDLELENPSARDSFTVASVDARAATILEAAVVQGLGLPATQAALWMDRGATGEGIRQHFEVTDQDLEQAGQLLAGLPRA